MAIVNGYCSLAEIKARLGISDTVDDTILENVVEAVSRMFDKWTRRRFYAVSETRFYRARRTDEVQVDDLLSVTSLLTDTAGSRAYDVTWATTDYDLLPSNAVVDGYPYTLIAVAPQGQYRFPYWEKGVKVTGSFGFASTTPDDVNEACLIQSERVFKRKDAPFGITGSADFGAVRLLSRLDPDVELLLAHYRRVLVG